MIVFVAPNHAETMFEKVSSALPAEIHRGFHTMLLGRPETDLASWTMDAEISALSQAAGDERNLHLVGFSGGAAICLAWLDAENRAGALTMIEPAWIGNDVWSEEEATFARKFDKLVKFNDADLVLAFHDLIAPGYAASLRKNDIAHLAAQVRAVWRGYRGRPLNRAGLSGSAQAVNLPFGSRSAPRMYAVARKLAKAFHNAELLKIPDVHHFDILESGAKQISAAISDQPDMSQ